MTSTDNPPTHLLSSRTAYGSAWLVASRLGTRAIDFVTLLVLARLLTPADFGVVAVALTLVQILEAIFELPTSQVLVRAKAISPSLLDTAFTLGLLRGAVLAGGLAAAAVPFALAYGDPRLVPLICFLSLAPALRGLVSPKLVVFARAIDFRRDCAIELLGKLCGFGVAITVAGTSHSYWGIAAGTVATPAAMAICSFALAPYRPRLTLAHWRDFASFIGWNSASQAVSAVNWQMSRLVLGALVPRAALGSYSLGSDLAGIPEQAMVKPVMRPLMSGFAVIAEEPDRLARAYLRATATLVTLGTPVMLCLSLLAEPAIGLVLGGKWLAAAPIVQWLALFYIVPLFAAPFAPLVIALGRNERLLRQNLIELAFRLPLIITGARVWGVAGVVAAQAASVVLMTLCAMVFTRQLAGISLGKQLRAGGRAMLAGAVCAAVLWALRRASTGTTGLALFAALAMVTVAAWAAYGVALLALWHWAGRPAGIEASGLGLANSLAKRINRRLRHPHLPVPHLPVGGAGGTTGELAE